MSGLTSLLAGIALVGGATNTRPALTPVILQVPAASLVRTSTVVHSRGTDWFAVAVDHRLRIYRARRNGWVIDGTVQLPYDMPPPGAGGDLAAARVTGGDTPDFTAHAYGADTLWFALVARVRGRWRVVPFDDQFARRHGYTFASGAAHGLIEGIFDSCGCASGPTTMQWYRYRSGVFVPTEPPGGPAPCSATALRSAHHWPALPYDPLVRGIARPFQPVRFACEDGWALATDGVRVSVYEQHGRRLDDSEGMRWLRVGVGTPQRLGKSVDFAMSRSLLDRLARRIGVRIPPARAPTVGSPTRLKRWQSAVITVRVRPGDTYVATPLFTRRPEVLRVMISGVAGEAVVRFRWRGGRWVELG